MIMTNCCFVLGGKKDEKRVQKARFYVRKRGKMTVPKYRGTEGKSLDAFTEGQSTESSVPVPGTVKSLGRRYQQNQKTRFPKLYRKIVMYTVTTAFFS